MQNVIIYDTEKGAVKKIPFVVNLAVPITIQNASNSS
jgi:hypothetical protein